MNISELLSSTNTVGQTRTPGHVFSQKPFGKVFAYNKEVRYKPQYSIIEVSMYITAVTQLDRTAHRVRIALKGLDVDEYSRAELIERIKKEAKISSTDATVDDELLKTALRDDVEVIKGKYILPTNQSGTKFLVIDRQIALSTQIRVDCTCADYYYTFAWYNCDNKVAIAPKPPAYRKYLKNSKSQNEITRTRNPHKKPGCCKHLLLLIAMLMEGGLLSSTKRLMSSYGAYSGNLEVVSRKDINSMVNKLKDELKDFKQDEKLRRRENKEYMEAERLRRRMVW